MHKERYGELLPVKPIEQNKITKLSFCEFKGDINRCCEVFVSSGVLRIMAKGADRKKSSPEYSQDLKG